jgi:hypothetical protein
MKLREVIDKITESASVMICYRHFFFTWTTAGLRQPEQYIILPQKGQSEERYNSFRGRKQKRGGGVQGSLLLHQKLRADV